MKHILRSVHALVCAMTLVVTAPHQVVAQSRRTATRQPPATGTPTASAAAPAADTSLVPANVLTRMRDDFGAMDAFRPSYPFWRDVFTLADGAILFGSALDGRLLAAFPTHGDWTTQATWMDPALAWALSGQTLPDDLSERRSSVALLFQPYVGPVLHNPARGLGLHASAQRYGGFLDEWRAIYERFGVPGGLGLAQALVESGFDGKVTSEAKAIGFCQWLPANWRQLQRLTPYPIESRNQTTQAAYCAASLAILSTKYGSFIPALSEHHAGGTNVARVLVNGERLGASAVREQYFTGADFVRDLRTMVPGQFSDVYGTYGPRSYSYADMIFGNVARVMQIASATPQQRIVATRGTRALTLSAISRGTGLSTDDIRRYNPALTSRVPAGATLYLPRYVPAFGRNVSFWHVRPTAAYTTTLHRFLALDVTLEQWNSVAFDAVLRDFQQQFAATSTEEGRVMATMLAFVLDQQRSGLRQMLDDYRTSEGILQLFNDARQRRDEMRAQGAATIAAAN